MTAPQVAFDANGWDDYVSWQTQDRKTLKRVNALIIDALRDPLSGIGKPEPLQHILSGAWSRRIDETNRLVYYVTVDHIVILQAREHYSCDSHLSSGAASITGGTSCS